MAGVLTAALCTACVGIFVGLFLGAAGIIFKVKVDEREEKVLAALPGNNCGGCGYPGCSGMAAALADGEGDVDKCKPSKADAKAAIKQYLKDHPKEA